MNVIFDCDCTIGIENCDYDDALALLYLLGREDVNLIGITATYGNSNIDDVMRSLTNFKKQLFDLFDDNSMPNSINKFEKVPIIKGGASAGDYESDASKFIIDTLSNAEEEVHIIGTGSTTNIGGSLIENSVISSKIASVTLMGGITEELKFEKKVMKELNLSCDATATQAIIDNVGNLNILTANNCLASFIEVDKYESMLRSCQSKILNFIYDATKYYLPYNQKTYGIDGYILWDVIATAYFCENSLFNDQFYKFSTENSNIEKGFLSLEKSSSGINCPKIKDSEVLLKHIVSTWENAEI